MKKVLTLILLFVVTMTALSQSNETVGIAGWQFKKINSGHYEMKDVSTTTANSVVNDINQSLIHVDGYELINKTHKSSELYGYINHVYNYVYHKKSTGKKVTVIQINFDMGGSAISLFIGKISSTSDEVAF